MTSGIVKQATGRTCMGSLAAKKWAKVVGPIGRSKTQAGLREIPLLPVLRDELAAHKATSYRTGPDDPSSRQGPAGIATRTNLRNRMLAAAVSRADELLIKRGQPPLSAGVTPHKLRHTFASILVALGQDPASVMAAWAHRPAVHPACIHAPHAPRERRAQAARGPRQRRRPCSGR
jgi:integrase